MAVTYLERGSIIWNLVEDNVIEENDEYKAIKLHVFDYKLFKEEEGEL